MPRKKTVRVKGYSYKRKVSGYTKRVRKGKPRRIRVSGYSYKRKVGAYKRRRPRR